MAVTFTDSIIDGYVWSLERPMYLRYSKDVDNSAAVVTIAITQGSFSKTLTLRYSGLIKEIEINISSLVKSYFQHMDYTTDKAVLDNLTDNALQYSISRTQKVIATITDDDGSINTTQFFIKNGNNTFRDSNFGDDNFFVWAKSLTQVQSIDTSQLDARGGRQVLNIPILTYGLVAFPYINVEVIRTKLDSTVLSTENFDPATIGDDKIIAIPIGGLNGDPLSPHPGGIIVLVKYYDSIGATIQQSYTFNYISKCMTDRQKPVWFEGLYGGINTLIVANQQQSIAKNSNKFTLQNGDRIALNVKNRGGGSLISEYVMTDQNNFYTAFFISEKIQIELELTDLIDILLTSNAHRIKQIDNTEMKQYTFAYEEVEQLKY